MEVEDTGRTIPRRSLLRGAARGAAAIVTASAFGPTVSLCGRRAAAQEATQVRLTGAPSSPEESRLLEQVLQDFEAKFPDIRVVWEPVTQQYAEIILPNAMPAVAALAIFSFQGSWNAFLEPLIYISRQEYFTLPLGLAYFRRAYYTDWPVVMAIAVVTTAPLAVFFIIFQRWFVAGATRSGIKG